MNENEATGALRQHRAGVHTRRCPALRDTRRTGGAGHYGETSTHIPGHVVTEIDPTGAGDTFCGATLAELARGVSPITAAERAVALAAQTVGALGPAALL